MRPTKVVYTMLYTLSNSGKEERTWTTRGGSNANKQPDHLTTFVSKQLIPVLKHETPPIYT